MAIPIPTFISIHKPDAINENDHSSRGALIHFELMPLFIYTTLVLSGLIHLLLLLQAISYRPQRLTVIQ